MKLIFLFLLLCGFLLNGESLDMSRTAAVCIPSGSAAMANSRSFGGNQPGMELKAEFRNGGSNRACWDFPMQRNLSQMAALRIRLRCFNGQIVSQFNVYIQTGNSWYACKFSPEANGKWEEIILSKTSFLPEGGSNSWQQCRKLRIAAWQGNPGSLVMQIASIEIVQPNVSIALLRSGGNSDSQRESYQYAAHLGGNLSANGLYPAVLEEDDCYARLLYPYQLLLLPYPAAASPGQMNAVNLYLKNNGRVGVFHSLPPILAAQMKFPSGNFRKGSTLPRPLAGIQPDSAYLKDGATFRQQSTSWIAVKPTATVQATAWWLDTAGKNTGYPAILEGPGGFWMTHVFLNQDSAPGFQTLLAQMSRFVKGLSQAAAVSALNQARFARANSGSQDNFQADNAFHTANQLFQRGQFDAAREYANRCRNYLRSSAVPAVAPKSNEFRAVWCWNPDGLPGRTWAESVGTLKKSGFHAIFPFLSHSGLDNQENDRRIVACLSACKRNNIGMHLWFSCLGVGDLPEPVRQQLASQGRLQIKENGAVVPWLCPNHPQNRQQIIQGAKELAQKYALDGIHLDLIRYPGSQTCYCGKCQADLARYPGGANSRNAFRRESVTSLVREIRQAVKSVRPDIKLSAAVYPDWQNARDTVGQDWVTWQKQGLLDFVCPMNYRGTATLLAGDLARQKQQLGNLKGVISGIGVTTERLSLEELSRQIQTCRNAGTAGFILFEYTPREAYDLLPALK